MASEQFTPLAPSQGKPVPWEKKQENGLELHPFVKHCLLKLSWPVQIHLNKGPTASWEGPCWLLTIPFPRGQAWYVFSDNTGLSSNRTSCLIREQLLHLQRENALNKSSFSPPSLMVETLLSTKSTTGSEFEEEAFRTHHKPNRCFRICLRTRVRWPKVSLPQGIWAFCASLGMELGFPAPNPFRIWGQGPVKIKAKVWSTWGSPSLFRSNSVPLELFTLGSQGNLHEERLSPNSRH